MKTRRADRLFTLFLILAGTGLSIGIYMPRTGTGSCLEVRIDGDTTATYPLSENRTETITCPGGGSNTLQIRDGIVFMTEADCPDRVCTGMRGISSPGETIVCLPHKLVLSITDSNVSSGTPDAITGT